MPRKPRPRAHGSVTLHQVAQQVGVSAITVSRALHQPQQVSEALRTRILAAVDQLGYVPNRSARLLASARSKTVAVLVPSLSNAVFVETLAGIHEVLHPLGYQVLIGNTRYDAEEETRLLRAYLEHAPDGVLLTGLSQSPSLRAALDARGLPAVYMMDLTDPGSEDARMCVGLSQTDAGFELTRHLLAQGRRRIAYLAAQLDERVMKRAQGYRYALQAAGCYDAQLEVLNPQPSSIGLGAGLLEALLRTYPDVDAVFCCNDDLALGALFHCQHAGIPVPRRLAIAGFNDLQASAWSYPPLTSIATPRHRIGFEAASMLVAALQGEPLSERRRDVGFELRVRGSTVMA
jgi:LacI family transcriptional regulator, gluconate utilization system Gnt-I transcriptional repressor